jgi:SOS response regulatory protein OraA/RecX
MAEVRQQRAAVEDPEVVLAAAARFLEARGRSIHEVRRRLTQAGYRPELIEDAIERLTQLGLLDDESFARAWVESRDRARPRGSRALRFELGRKGVDAATVDEVIAERDQPGGEPVAFGARRVEREDGQSADEAGARRVLARNAAALARVADPRKRRQRAYALLARSGFDPGLIGDLVSELDRTWVAGGNSDPGEAEATADHGAFDPPDGAP